MLGCTVTRRAVDLGCSLDRVTTSALLDTANLTPSAAPRCAPAASINLPLTSDQSISALSASVESIEASPSPVFSSCGTWMVTSSLSPGPPELSVDVPFGLRRSVASLRRTSMGVTSALIELTETPSS